MKNENDDDERGARLRRDGEMSRSRSTCRFTYQGTYCCYCVYIRYTYFPYLQSSSTVRTHDLHKAICERDEREKNRVGGTIGTNP
jgi:hypothetical protein